MKANKPRPLASFNSKGDVMLHALKKLLDEYDIKEITHSNFEQVMEIYNSNQKIFVLTEGKETTPRNKHQRHNRSAAKFQPR